MKFKKNTLMKKNLIKFSNILKFCGFNKRRSIRIVWHKITNYNLLLQMNVREENLKSSKLKANR
jgi:hypothetical protein